MNICEELMQMLLMLLVFYANESLAMIDNFVVMLNQIQLVPITIMIDDKF